LTGNGGRCPKQSLATISEAEHLSCISKVEPAASLIAEAGIAIFKVAFKRWTVSLQQRVTNKRSAQRAPHHGGARGPARHPLSPPGEGDVQHVYLGAEAIEGAPMTTQQVRVDGIDIAYSTPVPV
jgi:hypothetical protein